MQRVDNHTGVVPEVEHREEVSAQIHAFWEGLLEDLNVDIPGVVAVVQDVLNDDAGAAHQRDSKR